MKLSKVSAFLIFVIFVPICIGVLATAAILLSSKFYWGNEVLSGDTGFKVAVGSIYLWFKGTLYYFLFLVTRAFIKSEKWKMRLWVLFVIWPIGSVVAANSPYNLMVKLSVIAYQVSFYFLFLLIVAIGSLRRNMRPVVSSV